MRRPKMIELPTGTFRMGSERGVNEQPIHEVRITQRFALSQTEVTQGQYQAVMGKNPAQFLGQTGWENLPVENVSWLDAVTYCNKLSELEDRPHCYQIERESQVKWEGLGCRGYRLPTEAEWEYAARADEPAEYAGSDNLDEVAWYGGDAEAKPHPVASKKPNAWHLYDLSGNVWEWVWDSYDVGYYRVSPSVNPVGPLDSSSNRVYRGGSWGSFAPYARVAYRSGFDPGSHGDNLGFRLARSCP